MKYDMTQPCDACPFLEKNKHAFTKDRLRDLSGSEFPCHKTADSIEDEEEGGSEYKANADSLHCAGALIFLEKRGQSTQMMRIMERMGGYDRTKLDMDAAVR